MSDICGYAKVAFTNSSVRSLSRNGKVSARQIGQIQTLNFFCKSGTIFKIDYAIFKNILVTIKKEFEDLGKRGTVRKATILLVFSNKEWSQLKQKDRKEHTLHGSKISSSKEQYSCLIHTTKPSSIVKKTLHDPRNASRKQ